VYEVEKRRDIGYMKRRMKRDRQRRMIWPNLVYIYV
jgi:hypothetical protein